MKKSLLALAVAALATSASAATVYDKDGTTMDIYGRVQSVVYSGQSTKAVASDDNTMRTNGRLGLNLRQQVTPGFAAIANAEWDVADAIDGGFRIRYMSVGADMGQFGTVKAGRFEDAVKYVLLPTDIFDDWGCVGQAGNDDKRDGMFGYTWKGYGFTFNVTAQMAADAQQVDGAYVAVGDPVSSAGENKQDINDGYAVSVGYTSAPVLFGPFDVRLGYGHVDFQDDANVNVNFDSYDQYAVSAGWGSLSQGLYLGALYNARVFDGLSEKDDMTVSGAEGVIAYGFANGISTRLGVNYKNVDIDNGADLEYLTLPVYAKYQVSPAFHVWGEARFDLGSDEVATAKHLPVGELVNYSENVFSVGARYTF